MRHALKTKDDLEKDFKRANCSACSAQKQQERLRHRSGGFFRYESLSMALSNFASSVTLSLLLSHRTADLQLMAFFASEESRQSYRCRPGLKTGPGVASV